MATDVPLEPLKVFKELSNKIAATKTHFEDYSAAVSKLLKLKVNNLACPAAVQCK